MKLFSGFLHKVFLSAGMENVLRHKFRLRAKPVIYPTRPTANEEEIFFRITTSGHWHDTFLLKINALKRHKYLQFPGHNKPALLKLAHLGLRCCRCYQTSWQPVHTAHSPRWKEYGILIRVLSLPALPCFLLHVMTACITLWGVVSALQAVSLLSGPSQPRIGEL